MEGNSPGQAFGALIFSCNGRGRNLFGEPHYDSRKIAEFIPVPSSGFLCNGRLPKMSSGIFHILLFHLSCTALCFIGACIPSHCSTCDSLPFSVLGRCSMQPLHQATNYIRLALAGEIGQVANSTALHGFTCAVGVLRASPHTDD